MTLTGIGPLWLYRSIFSLFSITTKGKQADESLMRLYICKYKTLLKNRAGQHHRGFYPSSYPRNCSLVIFNKLDTLNFINQSISLRGFFYLQLKYTITHFWSFNFRWIIKAEACQVSSWFWINLSVSINLPAIYVAKCWPISLHF